MPKKLHYAGATIDVADSVHQSDVTSAEGTITVRTRSGGFLTFVTGPGIAIALEETAVREPQDLTPIVLD